MVILAPFDPTRQFEARTFVPIRGRKYRKGDVIERYDGDDRVLRRLYDLHRIAYASDGARAVPETTEAERFISAGTEVRAQKRGESTRAQGKQADEVAGGDEAEQARLLAKRNNRDDLFKMASGLAGVTKDQTKAEIALALVRAGRGTA